MSQLIHIPLDFELREEVRRLWHRMSQETEGAIAKSVSVSIVFRLWCDWGRSGCEWRPLTTPFLGEEHPWEKEEMTWILEELCEWKLAPVRMVGLLLRSGVLRATARGDVYGLELHPDFWKLNQHLAPDYITPSAKGGHAKAAKRVAADLAGVALQQAKLLSQQDELVFSDPSATAEENQRAVGLIMRMDRACGIASVRATAQYTESLVRLALSIVRKVDSESVTRVEKFLHAHRNDPAVVKVPDQVIEKFHEYLERA